LIFTRQRTLAGESATVYTPCRSRRLYPELLNGVHKNLSNLELNFVTYLRD
jgi:hypothetical protein